MCHPAGCTKTPTCVPVASTHVKSWETETGESQGLALPLAKADELQAQQETRCQSKVENDQERHLVSTTACMYTDSHTFSPHMHTGQDEAEASRGWVYVCVGSLQKNAVCLELTLHLLEAISCGDKFHMTRWLCYPYSQIPPCFS